MRRSARITRSPLAYWMVVGVLALLTGMVAARLVGNAGALASRYGPLEPVVVAARALEPGAVLADGDVGIRQVPGSLVPDGAVGAIADAVGRTVLAPVFPGVPIVAEQLAPDGRRGLTALLPAGSRAVAVPNGRPGLALVRG
ncbi:MAG TPA: Flp pilus assembly protein CpaB, partial [Acidimicrobiales bacterium]